MGDVQWLERAKQTKSKRIAHVTSAVLPEIEGMLPVVWCFWMTVGHDHLGQRNAPKDLEYNSAVLASKVRKGNIPAALSHGR